MCQNTAISKLVYDFISGFLAENDDGSTTLGEWPISLYSAILMNTGNPFPRPNTLLIDSEQLESGEALDDNFRAWPPMKLNGFRREILERGAKAANEIQKGKALDHVRCYVK